VKVPNLGLPVGPYFSSFLGFLTQTMSLVCHSFAVLLLAGGPARAMLNSSKYLFLDPHLLIPQGNQQDTKVVYSQVYKDQHNPMICEDEPCVLTCILC
jgi:hypothetical protein